MSYTHARNALDPFTADSHLRSLVAGCRRSDQRAWAELIATFRPLVWVTVRSFGLGTDDAEDLCQATWMRVFQGIHLVEEPGKIRAWIVTVAKREALRHVGRPRRDHPVGDDLDRMELPAMEATPEERAVAAADAGLLERRILDLPESQRKLLFLLFGEADLTYAEISRRLQIPHGSIGPTRQRILKALGDQLGSPYGHPDAILT